MTTKSWCLGKFLKSINLSLGLIYQKKQLTISFPTVNLHNHCGNCISVLLCCERNFGFINVALKKKGNKSLEKISKILFNYFSGRRNICA